ncbi:MAG: hypothetical protein K0U66_07995 [Gammaproteobacteria bacterium]|nr:hypothetical protein [Gammaproteobacteria bacterium]
MKSIIGHIISVLIRRIAALVYGTVCLGATAAMILNKRLRLHSDEHSRRMLRQRMGFVPRGRGRGIWIHGASLGEINAVASLVGELRKEYPGRQLIISLMNESDFSIVAKQYPQDTVVLLPVDFSKFVARALDRAHPALVVFTEAEIWPNFVRACARRSIPVHLVNARVSRKAARLYSLIPAAFRQMFFAGFSSIQVRDENDLERYLNMGVSKDVVSLAGSMRWNYSPPANLISSGGLLAERINRPSWAAASVHRADIGKVLSIHQYLRLHIRDVLLMIVPRYPTQDAEFIERTLRARGLSYQCIEENLDLDSSDGKWFKDESSVLLVKRTGELARWYAVADLALIGGSFDSIGGHNPIEAAMSDCAVFSGANVENFEQVYRQLGEYQACVMHSDPVALGEYMLKTFSSSENRRTLCSNALACVRSQRLEVSSVAKKLAEKSGLDRSEDAGTL